GNVPRATPSVDRKDTRWHQVPPFVERARGCRHRLDARVETAHPPSPCSPLRCRPTAGDERQTESRRTAAGSKTAHRKTAARTHRRSRVLHQIALRQNSLDRFHDSDRRRIGLEIHGAANGLRFERGPPSCFWNQVYPETRGIHLTHGQAATIDGDEALVENVLATKLRYRNAKGHPLIGH